MKVRATLGPEASDDKEASVLNRIIRWESQRLLYEADPRHVEKLLREMEMEECRPVTRLASKYQESSVVGICLLLGGLWQRTVGTCLLSKVSRNWTQFELGGSGAVLRDATI